MYSLNSDNGFFCVVDILEARGMLDAMDWVDRARKRLKQLGKRQIDLIPVLGVSTQGAVGHYLNRRREPSLSQLKALCEFLDCSIEWLVTGEGPAPDEARTVPKTEAGRELVKLMALAEEAIDRYEVENDVQFSSEETWDLLYKVVEFVAPQHFSDEFVKQYTLELARKSRNVN